MKACVLRAPALIETNPLEFSDVPTPRPAAGEVLVQVTACGVCRTDLDVVEGELPPRKSPVIPGHQVVGVVEACGDNARKFSPGARVGIAWLHRTDGICSYCRSGAENLCDSPDFTGYTVDGGYAEAVVAPEDFIYAIPEGFGDHQAAPLLCAGIIGFRSLRLSGIEPGGRLGFYGFGAAAHVAIQVARHWKVEVDLVAQDQPAPARLLIGDTALRAAQRGSAGFIYDLGLAWRDFTGHDFVFGLWCMRREFVREYPQETAALYHLLQTSYAMGRAHREGVVAEASHITGLDGPSLHTYFEKLVYELDHGLWEGLIRFMNLLGYGRDRLRTYGMPKARLSDVKEMTARL